MAQLIDTTLSGSLIIKPSTQSSNQLEFNTLGIQHNVKNNDSETVFKIGSETKPFGNFYGKGFSSNIQGNQYAYLRPYKIGTAETIGQGRLTLGNPILKGTAGNATGLLFLYGENNCGTFIKTANNDNGENQHNTITLPNKSGVVALEGHTHTFSTEGVTFAAEKDNPNYSTDIKYAYVWGSPELDMFVVRGYCKITFPKNKKWKKNTPLTFGYLISNFDNMLPGGLTALTIYRTSALHINCAGAIKGSKDILDSNNIKIGEKSELVFKNSLAMGSSKKKTSYGFYFSAVYGKTGDSYAFVEPEEDIESDVEEETTT